MGTDTAALPVLPELEGRIPQWTSEKLAFRPCPLCRGSNQPLLIRPDRLPVAFCGGCQLWYVVCLPPMEEIHKLYQGYWFSFRPKDLSRSHASRLLSDREALKDDIRLNRLAALSGGLSGKRLLEIGCGCGEMLVGARHRGASVFGNDISQEACLFVRERLCIPVLQGPLSAPDFVAEFGAMDMVVMSDLIEHPVEPLETFESALSVLKPGGLLLILTPNGGGAGPDAGNLQSATEWVGFRKDLEHFQYFSTGTVALLANRYQCRIEHLETFGYPIIEGIGRVPSAGGSWKSVVRTRLTRFALGRKLVRAVRLIREASHDPRCGTYILLAILRK